MKTIDDLINDIIIFGKIGAGQTFNWNRETLLKVSLDYLVALHIYWVNGGRERKEDLLCLLDSEIEKYMKEN